MHLLIEKAWTRNIQVGIWAARAGLYPRDEGMRVRAARLETVAPGLSATLFFEELAFLKSVATVGRLRE